MKHTHFTFKEACLLNKYLDNKKKTYRRSGRFRARWSALRWKELHVVVKPRLLEWGWLRRLAPHVVVHTSLIKHFAVNNHQSPSIKEKFRPNSNSLSSSLREYLPGIRWYGTTSETLRKVIFDSKWTLGPSEGNAHAPISRSGWKIPLLQIASKFAEPTRIDSNTRGLK